MLALGAVLGVSAHHLVDRRGQLGRQLAGERLALLEQGLCALGQEPVQLAAVAKVPGAEPRLDGVSTSYSWEPELRSLERAFRENPEADVPAPRWAGRSHIANLNQVHRRLREGRREERVIG